MKTKSIKLALILTCLAANFAGLAFAQICPHDRYCSRGLDLYRYPFQQHSALNFDQVWRPPVLTMSARDGTGLHEMWDTVLRHRQVLTEAGEFDARRRAQQVDWTWSMVRDAVLDRVMTHPAVKAIRAEVERQVRDGELPPAVAAQRILDSAAGELS